MLAGHLAEDRSSREASPASLAATPEPAADGLAKTASPAPAAGPLHPRQSSSGGWSGTAISLAMHAVLLLGLVIYGPWLMTAVPDDSDEISVDLVDAPPEQPAPSQDNALSDKQPRQAEAATPSADEAPAMAPPAEVSAAQLSPSPSSETQPQKELPERAPPMAAIAEPQPVPAPQADAPVQALPAPVPVESKASELEREREAALRERAQRRAEEAKREKAEAIARERAQRRADQAKRDLEAKAEAVQSEARERAARAGAEGKRQVLARADVTAPTARTEADPAAASAYRGLVIGHLAGFKRYPPAARARGAQGNPAVAFSVDDSGRVVSVSLVRGSGDADIDAEVVAMVRRASPFPPPPRGASHVFSAGINFRLQ